MLAWRMLAWRQIVDWIFVGREVRRDEPIRFKDFEFLSSLSNCLRELVCPLIDLYCHQILRTAWMSRLSKRGIDRYANNRFQLAMVPQQCQAVGLQDMNPRFAVLFVSAC